MSRIAKIAGVLSLQWLAGPIFGKELRSLSRRGRHYWLRLIYVGVLSLFVVITWLNVVEAVDGPHGVYRMSDAGKTIIAAIAWFQFVAVQLVAVAMMSTAVSEEVHHRTLGVLMTTPITRWQIVGGKLLARLLQLVQLLLISLPILAVVRVFGGVPIGFVIGSGCVTLTAALFCGMVAMFYSTLFRKAYASILLTLATLFGLNLLVPLIVGLILAVVAMGSAMAGGASADEWMMKLFLHINPFWAMGFMTTEALWPAIGGQIPFAWPVHCLAMLAATFGVLLPTVALVRRAGRKAIIGRTSGVSGTSAVRAAPLRLDLPAEPPSIARLASACDQPGPAPPPLPAPSTPRPAPRSHLRAKNHASRPLRRITGSPVVWRKLRTPMIASKVLRIVALCLVAGLMLIFYALLGKLDALDNPETQVGFMEILMLCGMLPTAVFAATSISSEREARTLPILLTTTLSDWQVLQSYVVETLRRSFPAWCLLFAHAMLFVLFGVLHVSILPYLLLVAFWLAMFLMGTGLYVSSVYRRTTSAVVMNLALVLLLWALAPLVMSILNVNARLMEHLAELNPFVQMSVVTEGCCMETYGGEGREFDWPTKSAEPGKTVGVLFVSLLIYGTGGLLGLLGAKLRLRRNLFKA